MSTPKEELGRQIVKGSGTAGALLGGAGGAAAASAGAAHLATATAAANAASWIGAGSTPLLTAMSTPATWAVIAANPVTAPLAVVAGGVLGAVAGYKLFKKVFDKK